ncbi:MAG: R3H domain-containing nucleic acid-binding protein [bacterium]|nr:R3H domain-containing nucleic acid-binding protein [bacterium]
MESVGAILKELLSVIGVPYTSIEQTSAAGQEIFSIHTDGDARALIGAHGDTIYAIDMLVKKIYEKRMPAPLSGEGPAEGDHSVQGTRAPMFLIDVNDYRAKQIKDLQAKVLMMAERARSLQYDVELSPMTSYERLIVHTTLQGAPNVKTESQGEGRGRRVVIKYSASV